ncbi:hypothetical protein RJ639_040524 [Escallonia herrerae]|uniref:Pentatricopeptide repeat-containing protein n=1 Tax=Escallonia herrerae TaxID=1293975 RepID=A0AA88WHB9_9ASTE|nr:hypothetical protein RJ639_040524 [Escallonia herrerae]
MRWPIEYTISSLSSHYRALLRSCARHCAIDSGEKLHAATITAGLLASPSSYLRNTILHMYAACGYVRAARKVFDEITQSQKDTVDWTTLVGCYVRTGLPANAISLFVEMHKHGVLPDDITFVCVFNACARLSDDLFGVQGHVYMIKMGWGSCVKACNAVMDTYVKCSLVSEARLVFDEMREKSVVSWTVLLEGVVKLEGLENGRLVFVEMPERNEVAWTIMIVSYAESGFSKEAFLLLGEMLFGSGLGLNYVTLCSLLSACTQSGDVKLGSWVLAKLLTRESFDSWHDLLGNALKNFEVKSLPPRLSELVFTVTVYCAWWERNKRCFRQQSKTTELLEKRIEQWAQCRAYSWKRLKKNDIKQNPLSKLWF